MARLILLKKHPFNADAPEYIAVNPEHISSVRALGYDACIVNIVGLGTYNVAYLQDELFYHINNDGEVPAP